MDTKRNLPRCGLIARCDNSGLGVMSYDFYKHLPISKTMVLISRYENFPSRYENGLICEQGNPTLSEIDKFLTDLDLIIAIETPYNWSVFSRAKERGIKTVLIPMYEWTPQILPVEPDLLLCPSEYDLEALKDLDVPKKYLPVPIDRKQFAFQKRGGNRSFVFNNGHGGYLGRNSLAEFLYAITQVDKDLEFLIRSQVPYEGINDSRIEGVLGEVVHEDLWKRGDIYVHLHKFDGLSLPMQEAMSTGYPIMALNRPPYNKYLAPELLIEPDAIGKMMIEREIEVCTVSPDAIAQKIKEISELPRERLEEISVQMGEQASKWSWEALKDDYINLFIDLCNKKSQKKGKE